MVTVNGAAHPAFGGAARPPCRLAAGIVSYRNDRDDTERSLKLAKIAKVSKTAKSLERLSELYEPK
ncbi:MAG TPA: hypothetical protein VER04_09165 [Polyangiaceae bacterium]|nr:hypothetical protein [Polyangiaceae bacterium]